MLVTRERLDELIDQANAPCVSLFMPTVIAGAETRQNPIRFKNLVTDAEAKLAAAGVEQATADSILERAWRLHQDFQFWQHQSHGLAVYLSSAATVAHRLPYELPEAVTVGDRPQVKPLLPLLTGDGRFYVLAFSLQRVRFFEGSRDAVRELQVAGMPESLEEVVGHEVEGGSLQFHSAGDAGGGGRPIYHGHGAGDDDQQAEVELFLRRVDEAVRKVVAGTEAPVVLAAVERQAASYRKVSHLTQIVDGVVAGNPDATSADELRTKAWDLVAPVFDAERQEAAAALENQSGSDRVVVDSVEDIVPAAAFGRVQTLFTGRDVAVWGSWDEETGTVTVHDDGQPDGLDLVEEAALQALRHGAAVYAVDADALPGGATRIAALLRY